VVALEAGGTAGDADVVVGTEAVFHGTNLDARPVRLVAFLDFDQELLAPRYRAVEQAMWLLVRAGRMLGQRRAGSRILVQTRLPDHEVLRSVRAADTIAVTEAELARRRALAFPPFAGLAAISGAVEAVARACVDLREIVEVRGPVDGRALVRAPTTASLCDALARVDLAPARALGRLRVEVDPPRV
jgi:primosomal protein N' (replication factor Y)